MKIDPALLPHVEEQEAFNTLVAAFMPSVPSFSTAEGLSALRTNDGFFGTEPVDHAEDRTIPGLAGPIPIRVIAPRHAAPTSAHVHFHGGGWCIGAAKTGDSTAAALADATGAVVVSVDYRLAPEHPFPAGPDDCEWAARWVIENAHAEWGVTTLSIGGGSAGAHLAALTLLRLRDREGLDAVQRFVAADLLFGCYDLGLTPSARDSHDKLVIPRAMLEACMSHILPGIDVEGRRSPEWSPLYADLTGLPPALFTVGTLDPLLDDSCLLYERWTAAGNEGELRVYPAGVHGFPSFPTELGRIATSHMTTWLATKLRDRPSMSE